MSSSNLKERLTRKFKFISGIDSESDFYLELIDYLVLLLSDTRLSYVVNIITREGEHTREKYNKLRKNAIDLLRKTRKTLQDVIAKHNIKEDDAKVLSQFFQHFDGLMSGKIRTSAHLEDALEEDVYKVIYKIVKDYPQIPLDKIAEPKDKIGNWILLPPVKDALESCKEERDYLDLERRHAVWGAWERLLLIPKALYTTDKTIRETFKEDAFTAMGLGALSNEMRNIMSKGVFQQSKSSHFKRDACLLDLTRIHNFTLDSIDRNSLGISILRRYKQRCEWFEKERLLDYIDDQKGKRKKIEERLTQEVSRYLHDNGITPLSEVVLGKVRPDLLGLSSGEELFPIEVKVIKSNEIGRLKTGFNQILTYLETIGIAEGFYIVYCVGDFTLDKPSSIFINGKRINIIVVNLFRTSPSQRKPNIKRVAEEDLVS